MATTTETGPDEDQTQQEYIEPLTYRTWILRVSIHCEGCRKKIKKILTNIDGVYTTNIDMKQQKVTVTGDVEPEILIKKITRAGRHAELWPENSGTNRRDRKPKKPKNKGKKNDDEESSEEDDEHANNGGDGDQRENGVTAVPAGEAPPEVKQVVTFGPTGQSQAGGDGDGGTGAGGGPAKKKKKKKKKKKNNNVGVNDGGGGGPPPGEGMGTIIQSSPPLDHGGGGGQQLYPTVHSSPRHHSHPTTYCYPPPQPPAYTVSYNTAHPSGAVRNTMSYYTAPPTYYSYEYVDPGPGYESPPSECYFYKSQPSDSFEVFSDENPNACCVM